MKRIGLLGGMSWESTQEYYRWINEEIRERLGGLHSAEILLYSVDFAEIEELQRAGDWELQGKMLGKAALSLARGGADFVLLCTNTMHKVAAEVERIGGLPLLHIARAAGENVRAAGIARVGFLGTRFSMQDDFCTGVLKNEYALDVIVPDADDMETVHRIIYDELCLGIIREESRAEYGKVIAKLIAAGAEGIVLGCTEIGLLVKDNDVPVPIFDTALIHARAAAEYALK